MSIHTWKQFPKIAFSCFFTGEIGSNRLQLRDIYLKDKRVLIHVDFNVILDRRDPTVVTPLALLRVYSALPTIRYCLENGVKSVVLASRLHHPTSTVCPCYAQYDQLSLKPLASALENMMGRTVTFLPQIIGRAVMAYCADPPPGSIILLEKLPDEEKGVTNTDVYNDYAKLADIFINDTFATIDVHRSDVMLGTGFRLKTFGMEIAKELKNFNKVCHLCFKCIRLRICKTPRCAKRTPIICPISFCAPNSGCPIICTEFQSLLLFSIHASFFWVFRLLLIPQVLKNSVRPVLAILGSSKMFEKITLLQRLVNNRTVDRIIVGGLLGSDFLP